MATSQTDLAAQMIAQLRVLDPSISADVGTPERKIIDTVAQALSEATIDSNVVSGALDLDSKIGSDLDNFLAIFGFGRQLGTYATGFVNLGRTAAAVYDLTIPSNTQIYAPTISTSPVFVTTSAVTLPAGSLSVTAPIRAITIGTSGNVSANTITAFYGASGPTGITAVNNDTATANGNDAESDDEFKVRFKNTVFRNLSGTEDQFLALGIATIGTTKANVVGPISRYREYIQIPAVDDATIDPNSGIAGNGIAGQYTTALSTIPYSKHIYDTIPYYVANGALGTGTIFYRQDVDFVINSIATAKNYGDTYREAIEGTGYDPSNLLARYEPNLTFYSIFTGSDSSVIAARPGDVVYFEHSYMSRTSRNDYSRNIMNCVDVFIDGENTIIAGVVIPTPGTINPGTSLFSTLSTDRFYFNNFRRAGEPYHRPIPGNLFTPMYWQPTIDLPESITVNDFTYFKDQHYWTVVDVSPIGGTVRSRNGIEWNVNLGGQASGDAIGGPYTGPTISQSGEVSIEIDGYIYDRNIIDLQTALDGNKQVTSDVLGHRATKRYFKPDITVMYIPGSSVSSVNTNIVTAVSDYFRSQQFGAIIQLSDILQIIHNITGVDNVRWSKELLDAQGRLEDASGFARDRVTECDTYGAPLLNMIIDVIVPGSATSQPIQRMYLAGNPTGGTFTLSNGTLTTRPINWNATASGGSLISGAWTSIQEAIISDLLTACTVTGIGTPASPFIVTFTTRVILPQLITTSYLAGGTTLTPGTTVFNSDFFLQDNELPLLPTGDGNVDSSVIIIRTRAQNTWGQL